MSSHVTDTLMGSEANTRALSKLERLPVELLGQILKSLDPVSMVRCLRSSTTLRRVGPSHVLYVSTGSPTSEQLRALVEDTQSGHVRALVFDSDTYAEAQARLNSEDWPGVEHVVIRGAVSADLTLHDLGALPAGLTNLQYLTLEGVGGVVQVPHQGEGSTRDFLKHSLISRMPGLKYLELKITAIDWLEADWPTASELPRTRKSKLTIIADLRTKEKPDVEHQHQINEMFESRILPRQLLEPLARDVCSKVIIRCPEDELSRWTAAVRDTIKEKCQGVDFATLDSELQERTKLVSYIGSVADDEAPSGCQE